MIQSTQTVNILSQVMYPSDSDNTLLGQFRKPQSLPSVPMPGAGPVPVSQPAQAPDGGTVYGCPPMLAFSTPLTEERVEETASLPYTSWGASKHPTISTTTPEDITCWGASQHPHISFTTTQEDR